MDNLYKSRYTVLAILLLLEVCLLPKILFGSFPVGYPVKTVICYLAILFLMSWSTWNSKNKAKEHISIPYLTLHFSTLLLFIMLNSYLKQNPIEALSNDHWVMRLVQSFYPDVINFTLRYVLLYFFLIALAHVFLLNAFFQHRLSWLRSGIAILIAILVTFYSGNKFMWKFLYHQVSYSTVFLMKIFGFNYIYELSPDGTPVIGTELFYVGIRYGCSGLEGISTFTLCFVILIIPLWRKVSPLKTSAYFIFGLIAMHLLNTIRIFILIMIGHFYDPWFAEELWHSYGAFVLYLVVIAIFMRYAESFCVAYEDENPKKVLQFYSLKLFRLPIDWLLLLFHSLIINITKSSLYKKIFRSNCQKIFDGEDVSYGGYGCQQKFCRFTKYYGSPSQLKLICPFINTQDIVDNSYLKCNAEDKDIKPSYWVRTSCVFLFTSLLTYSYTVAISNYSNTQDLSKLPPEISVTVVEKTIEEAKSLIAQQNYQRALKLLRYLEFIGQASAELYVLQGDCFAQTGQSQYVLECYRRAYLLDSSNQQTVMRIIETMFRETLQDRPNQRVSQHIITELDKAKKLGIPLEKLNRFYAFFYLHQRNFHECKKYLAMVREKTLHSYIQACLFFEEKQYAKALPLFEQLLVDSLYHFHSSIYIFNTHIATRDLKKAISFLEPKKEQNIEYSFQLIKAYLLRKNLMLALKTSDTLLKKAQKKQKIYYGIRISYLLLEINQLDSSLNLAKETYKLAPNSSELNALLAKIYFRKNLHFQSSEHAKQALHLSKMQAAPSKKIVEVYQILAQIAYQETNWEKSFKYLSQALKLKEQQKDIYTSLGLVSQKMGQHSQAITFYQAALKLGQKDATVYLNLALSHYNLKEWDQFVYLAKKSLEISPNYLEAMTRLASFYHIKNDFANAEKQYKEIIHKFPKQCGFAANNLAELYLQTSQLDKSLEMAQLAYKQIGILALDVQAWAYFRKGKVEKAAELYQGFVNQYPHLLGVHYYRYGEILEKLGKTNKAIQMWNKAITLPIEKRYEKAIREKLEKN